MAAQKGKDLLLKIDDGTGLFVTVAGLRTRRFTLNAEAVDITHQESTGRWRELLAGAGVRRASVSGAGVFKGWRIGCAAAAGVLRWVDPQLADHRARFRHHCWRVPHLQPRLPRRPCWRGDIRPVAGKRRAAHLHRDLRWGMANRHRGDVDLDLGGEVLTLRLTLGALAEIEAAFGAADLSALGQRLASGRISASDIIKLLAAAARGGGHHLSDDEFARKVEAAHLPACVAAVAGLMQATFGEAA